MTQEIIKLLEYLVFICWYGRILDVDQPFDYFGVLKPVEPRIFCSSETSVKGL